MSISPRNDQKFVESVSLYEVNNWTTIDRVCDNLRKLVDNGLIPKSYSLPELSVESITKFAGNMYLTDTDSRHKDQNFIRSVILYEILIGEMDKDKIYKKLLRRIGSDVIDYLVYSHWYDQFKNGYFNIDDDNLVSEFPAFSDLPMDVIEIVVGKLELKEQLCLRKLSQNLRIIVDRQKPAYKKIEFDFDQNHVHVKFNDKNVMYCDTGFGVVDHNCFSDLENIKIIESIDYIDIAFSDVAFALKNPKLQLESLEFYHDSTGYSTGYENAARIYEKMGNLLETLNHKISVKEFSIMTNKQHQLMSILPYLQPGVLEVIEVHDDRSKIATNFDIDELAVLDQWKYAKDVTIDARISSSIEHFLHFNRVDIRLHSINTANLIQIRDEMLKSSKFQYLEIDCADMPSFVEIERIFGLQVLVNTQHWQFCRCPIPNSIEFFQFGISDCSLYIERMSR